MRENIKEVLMRRDNLTDEEAEDVIKEARSILMEYLADDNLGAAFDVCEEMFGLEPDYLEDLLW